MVTEILLQQQSVHTAGARIIHMKWHDISNPSSSELDVLSTTHSLHTLHVEDCRNGAQRIKVDHADRYLFVILKLLLLDGESGLGVRDLALFVGSDFLITVHDGPVEVIEILHAREERLNPAEVLYRLMDGVVESYLPLIDEVEDRIETLQDLVVGRPRPMVLESISNTRSTLMHLRRVLAGTRHVAFQLRHVDCPFIAQELLPFLRDVHDDLAIDLDTIAAERERLTGVLDVYLSSVANRTTEATRTLTLLGTIALPAIVITSFFGMGVAYPSWVRSPWAFGIIVALTIALTLFLLWYLKRGDYLPGGSTSHNPLRAKKVQSNEATPAAVGTSRTPDAADASM